MLNFEVKRRTDPKEYCMRQVHTIFVPLYPAHKLSVSLSIYNKIDNSKSILDETGTSNIVCYYLSYLQHPVD